MNELFITADCYQKNLSTGIAYVSSFQVLLIEEYCHRYLKSVWFLCILWFGWWHKLHIIYVVLPWTVSYPSYVIDVLYLLLNILTFLFFKNNYCIYNALKSGCTYIIAAASCLWYSVDFQSGIIPCFVTIILLQFWLQLSIHCFTGPWPYHCWHGPRVDGHVPVGET